MKRRIAFLLALLIVMTSFTMPQTVHAAKAKNKTGTIKVTDTKLSNAFKYQQDAINLNDKYVVLTGKNKKEQNVYAYSKNGTVFSKTYKLGMAGEPVYMVSGKRLYVISMGKMNNELKYKCVTNPKKLASASVIDIYKKVKLPAGYRFVEASINYPLKPVGTTGKVIFDGIVYGANEQGTQKEFVFTFVLDGTKVNAVNATELLETTYDENDESKYVYLPNPDASGYEAVVLASSYSYNELDDKVYFDHLYYTEDGINFYKKNWLTEQRDSIAYKLQWVGNDLVAYKDSYFDNEEGLMKVTLPSNNNSCGIYYLYAEGGWIERTTSIPNEAGFIAQSHYSYATFTDYTNKQSSFLLTCKFDDATAQAIYSKDGLEWTVLPKLVPPSKYQDCDNHYVNYYKTQTGTYAEVIYQYEGLKSNVNIYKLSKNQWKKVTSLNVNGASGIYASDFFNKIPTAIYATKKKATGYNLKTKKSYTLSFTPYDEKNDNIKLMHKGKVLVLWNGKYLYATKDGYKAVTKLTMKSGKKTVKKNIRGYQNVTFKNKAYYYIQTSDYKTYTLTETNINKIK